MFVSLFSGCIVGSLVILPSLLTMHDFTLYSHEVKHFAFSIIYNITMKHCLSRCGWDGIYAEFTAPHYLL